MAHMDVESATQQCTYPMVATPDCVVVFQTAGTRRKFTDGRGLMKAHDVDLHIAQADHRAYMLPSATWVYAEVLYSQADAQKFCQAADGTLAVPSTLDEHLAVFTLLNATVLPQSWNLQLNATPPGDAKAFGRWKGLNLSGTFVNASCTVMILNRSRQYPGGTNLTMPLIAQLLSWSPWPCVTSDSDQPLPALCKLPPNTYPATGSSKVPTGVPQMDAQHHCKSAANTSSPLLFVVHVQLDLAMTLTQPAADRGLG